MNVLFLPPWVVSKILEALGTSDDQRSSSDRFMTALHGRELKGEELPKALDAAGDTWLGFTLVSVVALAGSMYFRSSMDIHGLEAVAMIFAGLMLQSGQMCILADLHSRAFHRTFMDEGQDSRFAGVLSKWAKPRPIEFWIALLVSILIVVLFP